MKKQFAWRNGAGSGSVNGWHDYGRQPQNRSAPGLDRVFCRLECFGSGPFITLVWYLRDSERRLCIGNFMVEDDYYPFTGNVATNKELPSLVRDAGEYRILTGTVSGKNIWNHAALQV
jgi:hypothetical protein